MICSSVNRLRFIVWSLRKGQTPVQPGLNRRGNVTTTLQEPPAQWWGHPNCDRGVSLEVAISMLRTYWRSSERRTGQSLCQCEVAHSLQQLTVSKLDPDPNGTRL